MKDRVIKIDKNDVDESGIVKNDFSQWNKDIFIENMEFALFKQNLNVSAIISKANNIAAYNVHCYGIVANNVHVHGSLCCESDVCVNDLFVDGDCVINGDLICDNLSVFGPLHVNGNLNSKGNINFYSAISIKGKKNSAFNMELDNKTPMIAIDKAITDGRSERLIAMFFKNNEPIIELLYPFRENITLEYFNKEFGCDFPNVYKYLKNVYKNLRGVI